MVLKEYFITSHQLFNKKQNQSQINDSVKIEFIFYSNLDASKNLGDGAHESSLGLI